MPCPALAGPVDCCRSLLPAFANSDSVAVPPFLIADAAMRQRVRLNASRKNGFVVTVSTRALKVDSLIKSLSGFDHRRGDRDPAHRLKGSRVLERRDDVDGVGSAPGTNISSSVGITNPDQKRK